MPQYGSFKCHLKAKKYGQKRLVTANQFNKGAKRNGFNGNCLKFIVFKPKFNKELLAVIIEDTECTGFCISLPTPNYFSQWNARYN
jgi:hypothetical protein